SVESTTFLLPKNQRLVYFEPMEKFILALDQGTTGTTVCLLNQQAQMIASINQEHPQIYPKPGWVEHDPEAIWSTILKGIGEVFQRGGVNARDVAAIGITNQR